MKKSRVPTTRFGRLARLGLTAGELAMGGAAESLRRLASTTPDDAYNVILRQPTPKNWPAAWPVCVALP